MRLAIKVVILAGDKGGDYPPPWLSGYMALQWAAEGRGFGAGLGGHFSEGDEEMADDHCIP